MSTLLMNIMRGASTVIDIAPQSNRRKRAYPHRSEEIALRKDWERVGEDLWTAIKKTEENVATTKTKE